MTPTTAIHTQAADLLAALGAYIGNDFRLWPVRGTSLPIGKADQAFDVLTAAAASAPAGYFADNFRYAADLVALA